MKAKISQDQYGYVTAEYDAGDRRISRTFMVPENGGYVREQWGNGEWRQVCNGLSSQGSTLSCSSRAGLLGLIRDEYRAMRRNQARYA